MQVTIFGASGQVGRLAVRAACDHEVTVRAVRRSEPDVALDGVEVAVEEDVLDVSSLQRATRDADVIISCLGQRRAHPRNPWSRLVSPTDLCLRWARALDQALGARSVPIVCVSAAGVGDSRQKMSPLLRWLFDYSKIGISYRDLGEMEKYLEMTGRDCLCVRPVTLTNGGQREGRSFDYYGLWSRISRQTVASYLVTRAIRRDFHGFQAVMIGQ